MRRAAILVWVLAVPLGVVAELVEYGGRSSTQWLPDLVVGWAYAGGSGLLLFRGRGRGRGPAVLLAAIGVAWLLPNLLAAGPSWPGMVTGIVFNAHRGPLLHLLLTYPGWRPGTRAIRWAVLLGYLSVLGYPLWQNVAALLVLSAALVVLTWRNYRRAVGPLRAARRRAVAAALVLGVVLAGEEVVRLTVGYPAGPVLLIAYEVTLVAIAGWLTVGLLTSDEAGSQLADLVIELTETRSGALRQQLARALGDPELEVGYPHPVSASYVDAEGRPITLPGPADPRVSTAIERDGKQVAVLVHDPAVLADPRLLGAVGAAARLSSDQARLQTELRRQLAEIAASRLRLVHAADDERARLEERLQRGAAARLAALQDLLTAARRTARPGTAPALERADLHLMRVRDDLDRLARGIHPRALTEHGLTAALRDLAEDAPLPVELAVTGELAGLPTDIAACVYFVCAEAIANAAKHAAATVVTVTVAADDEQLDLEIVDDGVGGADLAAGSGLHGLADRLEALGGSLDVTSGAGRGTRLFAALPVGAG